MNSNFDMQAIGDRVCALRAENNLTQAELADALHITREHLNKIERGNRACGPELYVALAEYFDVSTDYLLTGADSSCTNRVNNLDRENVGHLLDEIDSISKKLRNLTSI